MISESEIERKVDLSSASSSSIDLNSFRVGSAEEQGVSMDLTVRESEPSGVDGSNKVSGLGESMVSEGTRVSSENKSEIRVSDSSVFDFVESEDMESKEERGSMESDSRESDGAPGFKAPGFRVSREDEKAMVLSRKQNGNVGDFASAYSMVDEGAAARRSEAFGSEASKALSYGFEPGDMVWGKVKSHPWWPGHIFSEAFATPSVRRTKRAGHLLVAFFGDSSYGWFDMAELISFEPHYAEKSVQTSSRSFVKAVEESVDEASRRAALGLTCRCRNPFNFRPTNVRGFFAVDVGGYEPGGVYSVMQIKKARESFQPSEALSFVQQLALNPRSYDRKSIECIQNRARALAYRKAAYEEFDETYAQAFGITPVRPSHDSMGVPDQAIKVPAKVPFSGPMVTAEVLSDRKSSMKPTKVKDPSKKDKYLFKRRDEINNHRLNATQERAGIAAPSYNKEGAPNMAPGDYVLKKRTPVKSLARTTQGVGIISGGTPLTEGVGGHLTKSADRKLVAAESNLVDAQVEMRHVDMPAGFSTDLAESVGISEVPSVLDSSDHVPLEGTHLVDSQQGSAPSQVCDDVGNRDVSESVATPPFDAPAMVSSVSVDGSVKKNKVLKRPGEDINPERSFSAEKKKKSKKEPPLETSSEHSQKRLKTSKDGEVLRKSAGKAIGISSAPIEKSPLDPLRKDDDSCSTIQSSDSAVPQPKVDLENIEVEIPELVDDLLALALDPFHGLERSSPEIVRQVFLRFRSLVYQKSLVLVPASEAETSEEPFVRKSPGGASGIPSGEDVRDLASKHSKPLGRPDDPTKAGRKRSLSGRQEEMSAKRLKKINELKSMTVEKKVGSRKNLEVQQEQKETAASVPAVTVKPNAVKKPELPVRVDDPVMLVMKFPPRTALPSIAELKARFARFGPLDYSAMRVFWKTLTCRVVFKHKAHGQAAYNYAVRNKTLFGHINVNYHLRDLGVPAAEGPESAAQRLDSTYEPLQSKGDPRPSLLGPRPQQPAAQLKSCLKKPAGDDGINPTFSLAPRESPRVKFMLGGEESTRGEQLMVNVSKDKNGNGGADSVGGASSSLAMDFNSKNMQKVIPTPPAVILPFPPARNIDVVNENRGISHFIRPPNAPPPPHYTEVVEPSLTYNNYKSTIASSSNSNTTTTNKNNIDISHQMLSLLVRCNDIVTDVNRLLGYVPYHPL